VLFFMAVDGVAPRAKESEVQDCKRGKRKVLAKGENLPDEKAFDSNCITPGMSFF
jgi:5'-3' exoribonuclease 1